MRNKLLLLLMILNLNACILKGTDSGNPGNHSGAEPCTESNPCPSSPLTGGLIQTSLCDTLERCGSSLRSVNCAAQVLSSTVLVEIYPFDPNWQTGHDLVKAYNQGKVVPVGLHLDQCISDLHQPNICSRLPSLSSDPVEDLRQAVKALLLSNPDCPKAFTYRSQPNPKSTSP